jgi:hypothetical protein
MSLKIENTTLKQVVEPLNPMKEWIVEYAGKRKESENVTVEMIVDVMADEFPEFIMALAEENFIRGYQQAMQDTLDGYSLMEGARASQEENVIQE